MFATLGYEVIDLHRRSIGGLNLGLLNSLKVHRWRWTSDFLPIHLR